MTIPGAWLQPDWDAPARVRAFATTRAGGVSAGEYASMNLGYSSGDDPASVDRNRAIVRSHLPDDPNYLVQVHGVDVHQERGLLAQRPQADAAVTALRGRPVCVLTADCMPLFLCDRGGTRVAVAHAGWRGMAAGVIENAVAALGAPPRDVIAWMGPAIGPDAFEVGAEVREAFAAVDGGAGAAFRPHVPGKFMADLYTLARRRLAQIGVESVHGGGFCTFHDAARFFSYRREKRSGRMGAFIWIMPQ